MLKSSSVKTPDELTDDPVNPVDTLVGNTNNLLRNLHQKYEQLSQNVEGLQSFVLKLQQSDFEEKVSSRLDSVEARLSSGVRSLKVFIESEDRAREQNMLMRFEDLQMLRQTTTSRLAVYETRLDTLEEMVLDLTQVSPPPPSPPPASTLRPLVPPVVSEDYEDLAGRDFSMLGLSSPGDLDRLERVEYDCLEPPCDLSTNR